MRCKKSIEVAYNGPTMGFVGSSIEVCGSIVTNRKDRICLFYCLSFYQLHLCADMSKQVDYILISWNCYFITFIFRVNKSEL